MQGSVELAFGFLSPWRRHYCVLEDDEFRFTEECGNPRTGSVSIREAEILVPVDSTTKFEIHSQGLTIEAKADSPESKIRWIRALVAKDQSLRQPENLVEDIVKIRDAINATLHDMMDKLDQSAATKLRLLVNSLVSKVKKVVETSNADSLRPQEQEQEQEQPLHEGNLSFHTVLGHAEPELFSPRDAPIQDGAMLSTYDTIKNRLLKENPLLQRLAQSSTREANRLQLPSTSSTKSIDILNIVKGVIGRDIINKTLPVTVYEPLTYLQKLAEEMMFEELLLQAHQSDDPAKRMLYVVAFALSAYSLSRPRLNFRAVLGETYELKTERYRFVGEQVGLNYSAFHCESNEYIVEGFLEINTQFTGRSIEVIPKGFTHVYLKKHKQTFSYNRCQKSINNLVFGEATVSNAGEIYLENHQRENGFLLLKSKPVLFSQDSPNKVEGWVKSRGILRFILEGSWNSFLEANDMKDKTKIRVWVDEDDKFPEYFEFTNFALNLNHLNLVSLPEYPATDSRFRSDLRAQEYQMLEEAEKERARIEIKEKQRLDMYSPLWFEPSIHELTNTTFYRFNGQYWQQREGRRWRTTLDIF